MVGDYTPQRYIWRMAIAWMSWLRLFEAVLIFKYFSSLRPNASAAWTSLNILTALSHIGENLGLVTLTFVSSTENYAIHEGSFIAFLVCGTINMLCATTLVWQAGPSEGIEEDSVRTKITTLIVYFAALASAAYLFQRHNAYCEQGVYSLFALAEYTIVGANIFFHHSLSHDLLGAQFRFDSPFVPRKHVP